MKYYQDEWVTQYCSDALKVLSELEGDSIDLLATDPPYGISFMGKDWDRALPDIEVWRECSRVLKPGAFAFVMSIPRADCLSRMIIALEDAGFWVNFTPIFWAFASGFPKAQNIGKAVDKRLGAEREVVAEYQYPDGNKRINHEQKEGVTFQVGGKAGSPFTAPATPQAKALDGSYGGFQPKPAVEVIIVAMKPLSEKTFVDQALKNQKGITWLDEGRIPYDKEPVAQRDLVKQKSYTGGQVIGSEGDEWIGSNQGRFPANLLVSDDVLNDGRVTKSSGGKAGHTGAYSGGYKEEYYGDMKPGLGDIGSFSRYFDLDKWWAKTFPFLIVPKASKSEKNKGLDMKGHQHNTGSRTYDDICANCGKKLVGDLPFRCTCDEKVTQKRITRGNYHPTVKPLKLMSYLITLGSRAGDTVLDPFGGSGTTALASKLLGRKCIILEIEEKYCEIAANRCRQSVMNLGIK